MKLFVSEGNPHCLKVLAALEETGAKCGVDYINHEGKYAWLTPYYYVIHMVSVLPTNVWLHATCIVIHPPIQSNDGYYCVIRS